MYIKKVKIVYLAYALNIGGAEMMLYRLLKGLNRNLYDPHVISILETKTTVVDKIEELGITVSFIGMKSKFDFGVVRRLDCLLKEYEPDIVQTQLFAADILGRLLGRKLRIPVVITSIRNEFYGSFVRYYIFKWTENYSNKTVFVSYAARDRFIELSVLGEDKARVIHNGLDVKSFFHGLDAARKNNIRKELNLPQQGFLFLAVGSLTRQKGYPLLFKAFSSVFRDNNYPYLVVVGSGPLEHELVKVVEGLNLKKRIIFIGSTDRVPELMAAADALVLSSLWEGLPGVVMEAMASELPVIATAVGGTPELVLDGQTGFLVAPGDYEDLASVMTKMVKISSQERTCLGKAGRVRVENFFNVDNMIKGYEDIYRECLDNKFLN